MTEVALSLRPAFATPDGKLLAGIGFGLVAAAAWSGYSVASRAGVTAGFSAFDLTALRFIVAGLVLLPLLLRRGLRDLTGAICWRGIVLALGAGPLFSGLYT